MSSIQRKVQIQASAEKVYAALTTPEGYRSWWCHNSAIAGFAGGESLLHFLKEGNPVAMRFRVDELTAPERVVWTCVANDAPPWVGTTLSWQISPAGGGVEVGFEHSGWQGEPPGAVAEGWDHFLSSLESYAETGTGQPW